MDQENNIDELDKMIFDCFESNKDVPNYINETIHNTLQKEKKQKKSFNIMKKVAMIIISFGIISTSIVFADDIINFITSIFTNSTEAIDSAVESGYVQNVDMDYVYDNDIRVRVDNIVLDDTNLDISFVYNYLGSDVIDSLELYKYKIKDENNNVLYELDRNTYYKENVSIATQLKKDNDIVLIDKNEFRESLLYASKKFVNCKEIIIEISEIKITRNTNSDIKNGSWNISIQIGEGLKNRESEFYEIENNKYLNDSKVELTETSLKFNMEFNFRLDKSLLRSSETIILRDSSGKEYNYKFSDMEHTENNCCKLYLEYDIGKFFENINNLELVIHNENKEINIKLKK